MFYSMYSITHNSALYIFQLYETVNINFSTNVFVSGCSVKQGQRQSKSLEGAKQSRGSRGQRAKPPEADAFKVLKS